MSWWEKEYTGLNSITEVINSLRAFFTAAGWVESNYTASDNTQILLKTKDTHLGSNGILHIVVNGSDIEFHAYKPGYAAFADPNSFDSPDDTYLVGGANYNSAQDYFIATSYPQKLTYSTFPDGIWLFSDGNFFYAFKTSDKSNAVYGGLIMDRQLEFGFFLGAQYNYYYNSMQIGGTITKGNETTFVTLEISVSRIGENGSDTLYGHNIDGYPGRVVTKSWIYINVDGSRELLELPHMRLGIKNAYSAGDTVTVGSTVYEFVYDNGHAAILVQQGTDPTG